MAKSIFETLNPINVGDHIEKKNGLSYLSWAWAWAELKKHYPDSFYTIYESDTGCFYHSDGMTAWVKTGVTVVDGDKSIEHIEYLPVMDFKNRSIPVSNITSVDVNKAVQRSLTKAVARHGLGLYIYAGEDLPEEEQIQQRAEQEAANEKKRLEAIETLKKTGSKEQIEYFETKKFGVKVDDFTFEQADGAVKQIIARQKEKEALAKKEEGKK